MANTGKAIRGDIDQVRTTHSPPKRPTLETLQAGWAYLRLNGVTGLIDDTDSPLWKSITNDRLCDRFGIQGRELSGAVYEIINDLCPPVRFLKKFVIVRDAADRLNGSPLSDERKNW